MKIRPHVSSELLALMKPPEDDTPEDTTPLGENKKYMSIADYAFELEQKMDLPVGSAGALCLNFHEAAIEYRRSQGITDFAGYALKKKT